MHDEEDAAKFIVSAATHTYRRRSRSEPEVNSAYAILRVSAKAARSKYRVHTPSLSMQVVIPDLNVIRAPPIFSGNVRDQVIERTDRSATIVHARAAIWPRPRRVKSMTLESVDKMRTAVKGNLETGRDVEFETHFS